MDMKTTRWVIAFYFVCALALFAVAAYATSVRTAELPMVRLDDNGVLLFEDCGCSL